MGLFGSSLAEVNMAVASQLVRDKFPDIDEEIFQYVEGVLADSDDFDSAEDVYDAIGSLLEDAVGSEKGDEIQKLCEDLLKCLNVSNGNTSHKKLLDGPV